MWLSAMFIGFAESVVVIQPIKVLIVALLLAMIFKDPVLGDDIKLTNEDGRDKKSSEQYLRTRGRFSLLIYMLSISDKDIYITD